ncbi:TetR/AcrR family transcriptional regulator [Archangium violaceum]|uniref:TetR/AcrR family transcriptional regulator n=1 Tax=Archangium violaceum TaxID=83451 RepID=UPI00194F0DF2|nr:TetR/AcrR family transcriptional regulator [Archangium violaceum]QRO00848.1 TetR/AcrR family transcriptional regulator [Archangium violaceum]
MKPRSEPRSKPHPLRERMKEEARVAILEAAEQVIAEQGLSATRMEDIATRVGVSVGSLYNYFEDRQRLLQALLDAQVQQLMAVLDAELERSRGAPYRMRLHGLLRAILEHTQKHFRFLSLLLEERVMRVAASSEELERHQRLSNTLAERIGSLNPEGLAQGVLRPEDAPHYPMLLLGMLQSTLLRQFLERQPSPVDEQIALLLRCFLEGASPRPG